MSDLAEAYAQRSIIKFMTLLVLGLLVLFIAAGIFSFGEIRYSLKGREADATVVKAVPAQLLGGRARVVSFGYTDSAGEKHFTEHNFENGEPESPFRIIYLPGVQGSELPVAERKRWAIPVFVVMLVSLVAVTGWWFRGILKEVAAQTA